MTKVEPLCKNCGKSRKYHIEIDIPALGPKVVECRTFRFFNVHSRWKPESNLEILVRLNKSKKNS